MTSLTEKRIKIGVYLTPSEIDQLENQAAQLNTSRAVSYTHLTLPTILIV